MFYICQFHYTFSDLFQISLVQSRESCLVATCNTFPSQSGYQIEIQRILETKINSLPKLNTAEWRIKLQRRCSRSWKPICKNKREIRKKPRERERTNPHIRRSCVAWEEQRNRHVEGRAEVGDAKLARRERKNQYPFVRNSDVQETVSLRFQELCNWIGWHSQELSKFRAISRTLGHLCWVNLPFVSFPFPGHRLPREARAP